MIYFLNAHIYYTVCICNDQTQSQHFYDDKLNILRMEARNRAHAGLYSRIHPSARPGTLIFQVLASPPQSRTDGWSTPPESAPVQGRTCCQSYPEPACSGRRTDLCLPCRLPGNVGWREVGGRRNAVREKQERLKYIKYQQRTFHWWRLRHGSTLFFLLFIECTAVQTLCFVPLNPS